MFIGRTFTHRNIRKGTWLGLDDRIGNQIDRVIIDQPDSLNVLAVRIYCIEMLMLTEINI